MNYTDHYNRLICKAKIRSISEYTETHHIIPKCLGGTNDPTNLVKLLPEEHYVAHQLLVKMYPNNYKLINAAVMMCVTSKYNIGRSKNKLFGWLRRKLSTANRISNLGKVTNTIWMFHLANKESKKVNYLKISDYIDNGWVKGRVLNFSSIHTCEVCEKLIINGNNKTCSNSCFRKLQKISMDTRRPLYGREEEFLELYSKNKNINCILKHMGFPGNQAHWGRHARELISQISTSR